MIPTAFVIALTILAGSHLSSVTADCLNPNWKVIDDSLKVTAAVDKQVTSVHMLGSNTYNGVKFMALKDDGKSTMGLYAPGDSQWTVEDGYNGDNVVDISMFNLAPQSGNNTQLLAVADGTGLYLVTEQDNDAIWFGAEKIYSSNDIYHPQAQVIDGNIWVMIQEMDTYNVTILYRGANDQSFSNLGTPIFELDEWFAPQSQVAMFQGVPFDGTGRTIWFYTADASNTYPYVAFIDEISEGFIVLSERAPTGNPWSNIASVSAINSADGDSAIFFRTGVENSQSATTTEYSVISLSTLVQSCGEKILKYGDASSTISSTMAPALTTAAFAPTSGGDTVTVIWTDSTTGEVQAVYGQPW